MPRSKTRRTRTAVHRPARRRRRFRHDELVAVDMFSGFGGLTDGIRRAGFTTILAANHNEYKTEVHEANHPDAEHWIADLVDPESSDYHSAADLPAADLLVSGISCTNHSGANIKKAYTQGLTLFEMEEDSEYEEQVTRSERDRATALCVLQYAEKNHPLMMLIECTTEFTSWGPAIPGRKKIGDGSTHRWWRQQLRNMRYRGKYLYLNSMFFGVGQSRDRLFMVFWDERLPEPNLEHRPPSYCGSCAQVVEAVWTWKTGLPPSGLVRYGQQYNYTCPRCRREVVPPMAPAINSIDLSNLGTPIDDRKRPLAAETRARAERCLRRFPDFPPLFLPTGAVTGQVIAAHRHNGDGQHLSRPMDTITSTHEKGMLFAAVNNYQGAPRGLHEALPTQCGSETLSIVSAGVLPFRQNTVPTTHAEPMPTVTADQTPGLLTVHQQLSIDWYKPTLNTLTDMACADWREAVKRLTLADCRFRMLFDYEVGRACDFDVDFPGYKGTFKVWGTAKQQIDGYGNAVSPSVGKWIGDRLRPVLLRN